MNCMEESRYFLSAMNFMQINEESNPPSYAGENGISRSVHDINKKPPVIY